MEFEEILRKRRSIRKFKDAEIPEETVQKLLELSNLAPSAGNLQARRVVVVRDRETKERIVGTTRGQAFIAGAPVVFVICAVPEESAAEYGERGRDLYAVQDATIFTSYLQLVATSLGLSSCWVGAFDEEKAMEILGLGQGVRPVAVIPVGYADETPRSFSRKSSDEIIFHRNNRKRIIH